MRRMILRSQTQAWAASTPFQFLTDFLMPALAFKNPVIYRLALRAELNVTTAAGNTGRGRDFAAFATAIRIHDVDGERVNLRGSSLRVLNQHHLGAAYQDPAQVAAASTVDRDLWLHIPLIDRRGLRPADFTIPVVDILKGGRIEVETGDATPDDVATQIFTINVAATSRLTWWADVRDELEPELKSRLVMKDYVLQAALDDLYPVNGLLATGMIYSGDVGDHNARNIGDRTLTSSNLGYTAFHRTMFQEFSRYGRTPFRDDSPGVIATEDETDRNTVLPFYYQDALGKQVYMPPLDKVHLQLSGAAIAATDNPRVIIESISDRTPQMGSRAFGLGLGEVGGAVDKDGYVKTASGKQEPVGNYPVAYQRKLPIKLAGSESARGFRDAYARR